jgi:hypothetical protein
MGVLLIKAMQLARVKSLNNFSKLNFDIIVLENLNRNEDISPY